jgi:hypothetical protein
MNSSNSKRQTAGGEGRNRSSLIAFCLAVLAVQFSFGAFSKVGTTAACFLKISVGRPTGMGDAFTAIADDPSAAYFNPAGLAHLSKREVMLNHIAWIAGMNHEYLTGVLPISGIGTVGLSITSLSTGDMEQTQIDNPSSPAREDQGTRLMFGGNFMAIAVTYSRLITDKLAFGVTAKAITEQIWNTSSSGVGADVGLLYNTGWRDIRLGAAVANFGSDLSFSGIGLDFVDSTQKLYPPATYKTTPSPLPITFRFGIADNLINTADSKLVAALDLVHPSDINETVNVGLEYGLAGHYFLRAGYVLNTDPSYAQSVTWQQGISAGAGIAFEPVRGLGLRLNYGYRHQGWLGSTHRVTLGLAF